ncbi:Lem3/Cdc50 [Trichodelitschia bisporula]|uniref:Lem3/Cdc50 n=1 Tax=Trichodelitschia bisporula TaxID=703511 RepID=A0A6G1HMJ9_9PEZI|nr:Lem3/Cdc50 [Trichodelitschia bisporula]
MSQTQQLEHTDSIESQDPHSQNKKKKAKSRRPANTAFRQQRLKAWQPILTPKTVLPLFFAIGVIFAPIGGLLLWASSQVEELEIDYSNCVRDSPLNSWATIPDSYVHSSFRTSNFTGRKKPEWQHFTRPVQYENNVTVPDTNICALQFDIEHDLKPPVLLYYRLTNFYQNHRRYVKSFDQQQLKGDARSPDQIKKSDCDPLELDEDGKPYYPCGLIANSMFNDTFNSPQLLGKANTTYIMTNKGIVWDSDKDLYKETKYKPDEIVPPRNWRRKWPAYNESIPPPNLHTDEAFQVWMRTAGLPTFSKLALRNNIAPLVQGRYSIEIWDEFNVTLYSGTKSLLISTRTVMGGKNPFLGIAYIVVGGLCILLGALFTATHIVKPRKLGDHTYLTWNNEQPAGASAATATGRSVRPNDSA